MKHYNFTGSLVAGVRTGYNFLRYLVVVLAIGYSLASIFRVPFRWWVLVACVCGTFFSQWWFGTRKVKHKHSV
ncbi:hypothetical protein FEI15_00880 [Lacticaseibacillus zeae]|uniref:Uncharacterized protein n=1 Tax=Lacticaseibacillus zeae TaxID=57037 RepID=A0A5R8LWY8_LACZE|nr:hypothetical protein FEI15_00880 [Lacticaseibacillus zeae]